MNESEERRETANDTDRKTTAGRDARATYDEQTTAGEQAGDGRKRTAGRLEARPTKSEGSGRRWPRWLGMVLLGLVILASGIVIGSVGTLVTIKRGMMRAVQHPEQIPERTARRLATRYDLSDEQQAQVQAILRERLQRMADIRRRIRPHLDEELDSLREEVARALTEEQQAQWREDFSRLRRALQVPMYTPDESSEDPAGDAGAAPASPPPAPVAPSGD